ncbi:MAG: hypothetical protein H6748_12710 [Spirochaetaceae bacterium]|nr:hypothetical protein [Myxococcales bacterium]MCB9724903.1 hypothetical protein [Spirochaetaceae bacterium]HPG24454.1 hypothetical protein [Myxococcota bacterium]
MTIPKISTEQMIALHGFFAEAVAVGEAALAEIGGCETEIEVHEIRCTALAEFGEQGLVLSDDLTAAVMGRLDGALPGSLALALEPEEALLWAQIGGDGDPLEVFVALGRAVLSGIARSLGELRRAAVRFEGGELVEQPELAMLVATHAPSDTLVLSLRLRIGVRDEVLSAVSHLLIEPKYLPGLLSALSAAVH